MNNYQEGQSRVSADPIRTPDSLKKVFKTGDETMLPHVNNTEKGLRSSEERRTWVFSAWKQKALITFFLAMAFICFTSLSALRDNGRPDNNATNANTILVVPDGLLDNDIGIGDPGFPVCIQLGCFQRKRCRPYPFLTSGSEVTGMIPRECRRFDHWPPVSRNLTLSSTRLQIWGDSSFGTGLVTIIVTGVNDAPTDINLSNSTVAENSAIGTLIGNLSTLDPDVGDIGHTYTIARRGCAIPD